LDESLELRNLKTIMIIIGISGRKHSGKDTVAQYLSHFFNKHEHQIIKIAFADALKQEIASAIYKIDLSKVDAKYLMTVKYINDNKDIFRPLMQGWGDFRRKLFSSDYWIKKMDEELLKYSRQYPSVVAIIPDVRFLNEAQYIKSLNGILIRVERDLPEHAFDNHPSESELTKDNFKWDTVIDNSGSITELRQLVKHIFFAHLCEQQQLEI
jgi:hypothetical protein